MLTGFQVSTGAYISDGYELLCESCFENGNDYCRPISNYELDEWQVSATDGMLEDEEHAEYCACSVPVNCEDCGHALREAFEDPDCEELREEAE
jgi:hypothetical protein